MIEKEVRDVVTEYYQELNGTAVVIVHGLEMLILDGPAGKNKQEIDMLVINFSKQYVLNVEVKSNH